MASSEQRNPELPGPLWVDDAAGLARLVEALERAEDIAFDTEADSFYSYREKVCLVQISAGGADWLVDPLAELDLAPLGRVLADRSRRKVFHDGEYDILILKRDFGFEFANLFDTRAAAAALGSESPGLAAVLKEAFDVELDKSMQRSDWSARPLSARQVEYARLDTHYLVRLMELQLPALAESGHLRLVEGECLRLERLEPVEPRFEPDDFARIKGARDLDPLGRRALRELFTMRDAVARERDLPPFKVLGNHALLGLAARRPGSRAALESVKGIGPRGVRSLGGRILDALERARKAGPLERLPRRPARDPAGLLDEEAAELHERLKGLRRARAETWGVDASLVLNRHVLVRLAQERPRDLRALASVEGMLAWQVQDLGEEILRVVERFESERAAGTLRPARRRRS